MKGNIVITSAEYNKVPRKVVCKKVEKNEDKFIWTFNNEDEAYRAAIRFMNADFYYVHRK